MQRFLAAGLVAATIIASAAPSFAGGRGMFPVVRRMARNFRLDYRENRIWPQQYVEADRQAVRTPMEMIITNGWQRQNTLNDHHFEEGSTELTEAGRLKVKWILSNVPPQYRSIFVERGIDSEATASRIASVQQVAADQLVDGEMPVIMQTRHGAEGWPAVDIDMMRRKYLESAPEPRLPAGLQSR